jgi:hypothetical protein
MNARLIASLIDGAIPFAGGVYITLLGFRVVGKKLGANSRFDDWMSRFGKFFRIGGPLLIAFGVFQAVFGIVRVSNQCEALLAANWSRYATSDGACSAEFPAQPEHETKPTNEVETRQIKLYLDEPDIDFRLSFSDIAADAPPVTDEERLDAIRDAVREGLSAVSGPKEKNQLVREQKISENGILGRELEFAVGQALTLRTKVFILNKRIYRIIAVTPRNQKYEEATKRFLGSFRFEPTTK